MERYSFGRCMQKDDLPCVDDVVGNGAMVGVLRWCPWQVYGTGSEADDQGPSGRIWNIWNKRRVRHVQSGQSMD